MPLKKENLGIKITAHIVLALATILALAPFILLISASITDGSIISTKGFSFIPSKVSFAAYEYLFQGWKMIGKAYLVTIGVTVIGTVVSMLITTMLAFALSWRKTPCRRIMMVMLVITMLFNGGAVATYITYSNFLHINNTIFGLIMPGMLMNAFSVIMFTNYFKHAVSSELMEAAMMDGANMFIIFFKIYLPLSLPLIATLGLTAAIAYWNDWNNGLYYIDDPDFYSIQLLLRNMQESANFMASNNSNMTSIQEELPGVAVQMAIAVIGILPILVAYPFFQKYFIAGIGVGGAKE